MALASSISSPNYEFSLQRGSRATNDVDIGRLNKKSPRRYFISGCVSFNLSGNNLFCVSYNKMVSDVWHFVHSRGNCALCSWFTPRGPSWRSASGGRQPLQGHNAPWEPTTFLRDMLRAIDWITWRHRFPLKFAQPQNWLNSFSPAIYGQFL